MPAPVTNILHSSVPFAFLMYLKHKDVGLEIGYIIPQNLACFLLIQARGHILPITDFPEFLIALFVLQQNRTNLYAS